MTTLRQIGQRLPLMGRIGAPSSALGKKRAVGIAILLVLLAFFFSLNRFPKLDTVREDLDVVTGPVVECFQGFCIERELETTLLERWWDFSITYLQLVAVGMVFAFLVAGLTEAFLFPKGSGVGVLSGGSLKKSLKGMVLGPVMNLCSACIVPVSAAFQRRGVGIEGGLAIVHGSSTLNLPGLVMAVLVFTPMMGVSRFLMGMTAVILLGPLVAMVDRLTARGVPAPAEAPPVEVELDYDPIDEPWGPAMKEAFTEWGRASFGFLVRMGPIMAIAGFASGLAIQWVSPDVVSTYLGNDLTGIAIAATFGILINVPLLFEIPLVALLLLMGMGEAPAAVLLFTAAAGGPVTFWGLASVMSKRAIAALATTTWTLGVAGGVGILAAGALLATDNIVGLNSETAAAADAGVRTRLTRSVAPVEDAQAAVETPAETEAAVVLDRPAFADVSAKAGIDFVHSVPRALVFPLGGGVVVFDHDGDGLDDIFIANMRQPNALYRNNGDATFTDIAAQAGLDDALSETNGGCAADYDNDGDQDLYTTIHGANKLFRNNGAGTFEDVSAATIDGYDDKRRFSGCAWGDYDGDGRLDLIVVSHLGEVGEDLLTHRDFGVALRGLSLFHNEGGRFANVTGLLGDTSGPSMGGEAGNVYGAGFQPAWFDYDEDGDLDLYVVNDLGREIHPNVLWRNDGPGGDGWKFEDVSIAMDASVRMDGMGLAIGDYDLDGRFDIFLTNINDNVLLRNPGGGKPFVDVAPEAGAEIGLLGRRPRIAWGAMFVDYDNDADEDLYVVSGYLDAPQPRNSKEQPNALLRNNGDGTFADVSGSSGADDDGIGRGGAYIDFDQDGCLDMIVVNYGQPARLFRNECDTGNSWLVVRTHGTTGNRDAIGAHITAATGGTSQIRLISGGSSSMGQNMMAAHFGLGEAAQVDSLTIRWPGGRVQTITDVPVNQVLQVTEPE